MHSGKVLFVSDVHLGLRSGDYVDGDRRFAQFLDEISRTEGLSAVYLLGDIFDFWYEYKYVIPKGFTRTLGAMARIVDSGIEVFFMRGNHDMWVYGYFERELGIKIIEQPAIVDIGGRVFCLGHGDGLGLTKPGFRILRKIFRNRVLQVLFSGLHPRWAMGFGYRWSAHSRASHSRKRPYVFSGPDEPICRFSEEINSSRIAEGKSPVDYFIFGHLHVQAYVKLSHGSSLFILDDWLKNPYNYIVFDVSSSKLEVRSQGTVDSY